MVYNAPNPGQSAFLMPVVTALLFRFRATSAALAGALVAAALLAGTDSANAQQQGAPKVEAAPQTVPGFWDPRRGRIARICRASR